MKKAPFIAMLVLTFVLEAVCVVFFLNKLQDVRQDPVKINDCMYSIKENYGDEQAYNKELDYVIIDEAERIVYQTRDGLTASINEAIKNQCLVLELRTDGFSGSVIFENSLGEKIDAYKRRIMVGLIGLSLLQLILILSYYIYIRKTITEPFEKMNSFAARVAEGNLDIPLPMDKKHVFGAFTEAFDLMRSELKKARLAEKKAYDDKKEMVAKLSHDIKTPVASIKSTSEVGFELTEEANVKEKFNLINVKSDQITTLVDNLFNSSVEDVTEIAVTPGNYSSDVVSKLIINADYLGRSSGFMMPECMVYIDRLRLQQALDNIFMNSYKYADTEMGVATRLEDDYLVIKILDFGPGVKDEEIPLLTEKYKRGSNIKEKDGAGLGLYLTKYFIEKMDGRIELKNEEPGFSVALYLRII